MLTINNTLDGFLKDVEIKGNTIQNAENLADIRSVGDKAEGQDLYKIGVVSCGKNLFNPLAHLRKATLQTDGYYLIETFATPELLPKSFAPIRLKPNTTYTYSYMANAKNISNGTKVGIIIRKQDGSNLFSLNTQYKPTDGFTKGVFTTDNDINYYISLQPHNGDSNVIYKIKDIQLEEGTQATPYEPYQEDKLTILSPVQLEKVGDVADRIICKDGVWGVEKNCLWFNDYIQDIKSANHINDFLRIVFPRPSYFEKPTTTNMDDFEYICNLVPFSDWRKVDTNSEEGMYVAYGADVIVLVIKYDRIGTTDKNTVIQYINNNFECLFKAKDTQFIPLPHDQQVKLRTFAGQTNMHFETEIEGTIKASVPKSLGATVNTHTEQIGNLSKELDRVKKLEESTVSTVTTESDFTTVEETSNGYFEDVKLEGKTLVNLGGAVENQNRDKWKKLKTYKSTIGKVYTSIIRNTGEVTLDFKHSNLNELICSVKVGEIKSVVFTCKDSELGVINYTDGICGFEWVLLEGDHTQNPPSYFEGLMSVGEDVEEVSVESVNGGNLFDGELELGSYRNDDGTKADSTSVIRSKNYIPTYGIRYLNIIGNENPSDGQYRMFKYDENKNYLGTFLASKTEGFELESNVSYITFHNNTNGNLDLNIIISSTREDFNDHVKSNKKPLLYYNNETQTWEKPILRQWDSIEKHSDGKYYYHKRSGEVVLNGGESWENSSANAIVSEGYIVFNSNILHDIQKTSSLYVVNNFSYMPYDNGFRQTGDLESISDGGGYRRIFVRIKLSKLSSPDLEGFKAWLQANPVTVVYQLAQEEVYECTNIDLITYENETNYIVSSGAITLKSTLKVHSNISNVVKILQEKVSLLESNVKASQEVQDMMILESDMRILDIELALMEHMPIKLNLANEGMLRSATYFNFIKGHIVNETYSKDYLENVMNKYLATNRLTQEEYDELYKLLYPPVYDIALPIEE